MNEGGELKVLRLHITIAEIIASPSNQSDLMIQPHKISK